MNLLIKAPVLAELGMVVLLAYMVSGWLFPVDDISKTSELPDQINHASETVPDLSELVEIPLFGTAPLQPQKIKPVKKQPASVALAPLTIRLLGTVVAEEASFAILSLSEKSKQQVFSIGDFIQPGVKLHYVDTHAMVIERSGRLERIVLEYGERLKVTVTGNTDPVTDLSTLMTEAKLVLHHDGDKADGFLINGIVVNSMYHKSGLYNGDIIRNINGTQLTKADQIIDIYSGLRNSKRIKLEVKRADKVKQLSCYIR